MGARTRATAGVLPHLPEQRGREALATGLALQSRALPLLREHSRLARRASRRRRTRLVLAVLVLTAALGGLAAFWSTAVLG